MENKQPLLSICIPTWNRSKFLKMSLSAFQKQLDEIDHSEIEIYVSDNCSDDDTPAVVEFFIDAGMPITYSRQTENVGAARNFISCMKWASGKYIILLGDDDLLMDDALPYLLDIIRNNDYGLIALKSTLKTDGIEETKIFRDKELFLQKVSYWITFMSGCIFLKEAVSCIENYEKYIGTHLLQVPFYISSALLRDKNIIITKQILNDGLDSSSNGGYNFYKVFVEGYLGIWKEFLVKGMISRECFEKLKKDIYVNFDEYFNYKLLIRRQNVAPETMTYIGNRKGFKIEGGWRILFSHYGQYPYFYFSFIKYAYWFLKNSVKVVGRFLLCRKKT